MDWMAQIDAPIGGGVVVMRREEGTRILVDSPNQYNRRRANCEEVTDRANQPVLAKIHAV
jgi:hypothetical protein